MTKAGLNLWLTWGIIDYWFGVSIVAKINNWLRGDCTINQVFYINFKNLGDCD